MPPSTGTDPMEDSGAAARAAGLLYVDPEGPGIRRRRCGRGFTYIGADGRTVRDPEVRRRIESLAIPPAWTDVWISPEPRGHLQATGRDDRQRKQYVYHERWQEIRSALKFRRSVEFGHALPGLRRRVGRDLARTGPSRTRVLATSVRLLDRTGIRVGHPQYAEQNGSYGLTTLRSRHVEARADVVRLRFRGKGGKTVRTRVRDPALADALREITDLPGTEILTYLDGDGGRHTLEPEDVTDYVRRVTGGPFSAKDFRTWYATAEVVRRLHAMDPGDPRSAWFEAVDAVAEALDNTRAVVRGSYVPPELEALVVEGRFPERARAVRRRADALMEPGRRRHERLTLALLEDLLA